MAERSILKCDGCDRVFTGRVREDGSTILPLDGSACHCGSETFVPVGGLDGAEATA